ncbi:helix-turn-helix domain-containing protein [Acidimangrovimonas sediminis]|uniref:helix-turn-helix domain-containing protein n=1 Tax=Acidimangrovimonas sediminis TaxID=2056283 RepID=UPI000C80AFAF|nr:helix-turn-helix domain-containing protein [Acidimangrovimonas sediminis]
MSTTASPSSSVLIAAVLRAEVAAARLEAACAAEPGLGNLWRNEAAAVEAVRSVGMEDVRVSESDLLRRIADDFTNDVDARGAEVAAGILRVLRVPRDFFDDPFVAIRRIEGATGIAEWRETAGDFVFESASVTEEEAQEIAAAGQGPTPILGALRGAARYGVLTDRLNPVAERLIFMAIEGALRRTRLRSGRTARDDDLALLSGKIEASWVSLPATALTRSGFGLWSPASFAGLAQVLERLAEHLEAEIGAFARLRHWERRARDHADSRPGQSHFPQLVELIHRRPVLTSAIIAEDLSVTRRTALNLIAEAEALDLLRNITGRRSARIWATPMMAERMSIGGRRGASGPVRAGPSPATPSEAGRRPGALPRTPDERRVAREEAQAAMDRAMEDFDAVLGEADAILSRMQLGAKPGGRGGLS